VVSPYQVLIHKGSPGNWLTSEMVSSRAVLEPRGQNIAALFLASTPCSRHFSLYSLLSCAHSANK